VIVGRVEGERAPRIANLVGNDCNETTVWSDHASPFVEDADEIDIVLQVVPCDETVNGRIVQRKTVTFSGDVGHARLAPNVADASKVAARDKVDADEVGRRLPMAASHLQHAAGNDLAQHGETLGVLVVGIAPEPGAAADETPDARKELARGH
jgi:hypothetical protein